MDAIDIEQLRLIEREKGIPFDSLILILSWLRLVIVMSILFPTECSPA